MKLTTILKCSVKTRKESKTFHVEQEDGDLSPSMTKKAVNYILGLNNDIQQHLPNKSDESCSTKAGTAGEIIQNELEGGQYIPDKRDNLLLQRFKLGERELIAEQEAGAKRQEQRDREQEQRDRDGAALYIRQATRAAIIETLEQEQARKHQRLLRRLESDQRQRDAYEQTIMALTSAKTRCPEIEPTTIDVDYISQQTTKESNYV